MCIQGLGVWPSHDPCCSPLNSEMAGKRLCGPFCFVLDGLQGDADFIASLFELQRRFNHVGVSLVHVRILFGVRFQNKLCHEDPTDILNVATSAKPVRRCRKISERHTKVTYYKYTQFEIWYHGVSRSGPVLKCMAIPGLLYTNWGRGAQYIETWPNSILRQVCKHENLRIELVHSDHGLHFHYRQKT